MNDTLEGMVRRAVAEHMGIDWSEIRTAHHFDRDLSLQPLDVVLIALRLEDTESIELPIDRLDSIETVAEMITLIRLTMIAARRESEEGRPVVRRGHPRISRRLPFRSSQRG